jgi:PKD repeat protein
MVSSLKGENMSRRNVSISLFVILMFSLITILVASTTAQAQSSPSAEFTSSPLQSSSPPLLVNFSAPGAAGFKCTWTWGDGGSYTPEGTCLATTNHVYRNPGSYTVSLHVEGAPNDVTKVDYIVVLNGPTRTPTCACLPITPTRTRTPTLGITNTFTRTPTLGIISSPTRTQTPPSGVTPTPFGTCGPINANVSAPFTFDGAGTFCWRSTNLGSYVNSWGLDSLLINGVEYKNQYVPSTSWPPAINGYWYVLLKSSASWGHVEFK